MFNFSDSRCARNFLRSLFAFNNIGYTKHMTQEIRRGQAGFQVKGKVCEGEMMVVGTTMDRLTDLLLGFCCSNRDRSFADAFSLPKPILALAVVLCRG